MYTSISLLPSPNIILYNIILHDLLRNCKVLLVIRNTVKKKNFYNSKKLFKTEGDTCKIKKKIEFCFFKKIVGLTSEKYACTFLE